MLRNQNIKRVASVFALTSWLLLLLLGMLEQYYFTVRLAPPHIPFVVKGLLLNGLIIGTFVVTSTKAREHEGTDLHELIWQVFLTALVCTVFSGIVSFLDAALDFQNQLLGVLFTTIAFHIELGLATVLLLTAYSIWKRMILYEKSKFAVASWLGFEYALFATTIAHFFRLGEIDVYFNVAMVIFVLWTIVVSVNLKWVPQLVFNQKLISIFQFTVTLFCLAFFLASIASYYNNSQLLVDDLSKNVFFSALFIFVVFYAVASLLVTIFNLPTSSVFERKIKELATFQELSEAINEGKSQEQIFTLLLESAHATVAADAAWLLTRPDEKMLTINITEEEALKVRTMVYQSDYDEQKPKRIGSRNIFRKAKDAEYNSVLAVPLISGKQLLGTLVLMKRLGNAFDNTMVSMVNTFVAQASIAIHNFKLISQAVENERYKNELEIAKSVQSRLLPAHSRITNGFEFYARSEFAREVGGDYYDYHQLSDEEYAVIIADVAGKGVPASFNMAQMKGIFQALVRLDLSPSEFLVKANDALGSCLEKAAFITATFFRINTKLKKVCYSRAGHCPAFFFNKNKNTVHMMHSGGLGLGIVRAEKFAAFVEEHEFTYQPGDLLMAYTDGLVEARQDIEGEEYGYDRLQGALYQYHHLPLEDMGNEVIESIFSFTSSRNIDDDYTLMFIRF